MTRTVSTVVVFGGVVFGYIFGHLYWYEWDPLSSASSSSFINELNGISFGYILDTLVVFGRMVFGRIFGLHLYCIEWDLALSTPSSGSTFNVLNGMFFGYILSL